MYIGVINIYEVKFHEIDDEPDHCPVDTVYILHLLFLENLDGCTS